MEDLSSSITHWMAVHQRPECRAGLAYGTRVDLGQAVTVHHRLYFVACILAPGRGGLGPVVELFPITHEAPEHSCVKDGT